jgi:ATP synthase protein I
VRLRSVFSGVEAWGRPPYNAPPSRSAAGSAGPSPASGNPLTNYDFSLARRHALMLVAGQVAISAVVALLCAALIGTLAAGSALAGGGIGVAGSLVQVLSAFRRGAGNDAKAIARGFYRGEALKVAVTVLLFVLVLRGHHAAPGPLFAGYVATFIAYWLALARLGRGMTNGNDQGQAEKQ